MCNTLHPHTDKCTLHIKTCITNTKCVLGSQTLHITGPISIIISGIGSLAANNIERSTMCVSNHGCGNDRSETRIHNWPSLEYLSYLQIKKTAFETCFAHRLANATQSRFGPNLEIVYFKTYSYSSTLNVHTNDHDEAGKINYFQGNTYDC